MAVRDHGGDRARRRLVEVAPPALPRRASRSSRRARGPSREVDLLDLVLADVADGQVAVGAVEREAPRVAQAVGVDLAAGARAPDERVRRRDRVRPCRPTPAGRCAGSCRAASRGSARCRGRRAGRCRRRRRRCRCRAARRGRRRACRRCGWARGRPCAARGARCRRRRGRALARAVLDDRLGAARRRCSRRRTARLRVVGREGEPEQALLAAGRRPSADVEERRRSGLPSRTTTICPPCSTTKSRRRSPGGAVTKSGRRSADLDQAHAAPAAARPRPDCELPCRRRCSPSRWCSWRRPASSPRRSPRRARRRARASATAGRSIRAGCQGLVRGRTGLTAPMRRSFDVIVIGAGPAGEVAPAGSARPASRSRSSSELVGGECSFYACMPSKALLRPGQALAEARRVPGAAEAVAGSSTCRPTFERRDEIVHDLDDGSQLPWLDERGVALVRGHGRLAGERARRGRRRDARGAARGDRRHRQRPRCCRRSPGCARRSRGPTARRRPAEAVPERLSCSAAGRSAARWPGLPLVRRQVTLVEAGRGCSSARSRSPARRCAPRWPKGIDVRAGAKRDGRRATNGRVTRRARRRHERSRRRAARRGRPAHADRTTSALETIGLEPGGPIEVGDDLRVPGHDWLYVVGDANGRVLLTHMGKYQARIAADRILGIERELRSDGARRRG